MAFFSVKSAPEEKTLGLYIHIPFCVRKCDYCDFYSVPGRSDDRMDDYLTALNQHLVESAPAAQSYLVDTVYFGGGTPSHFGGARLAAVLRTIRKNYRLTKDCEITMELNPDSTDKPLLNALRKAGVNRLSMGVQSADNGELTQIGRLHNFSQAEEAFELARDAGFQNISLDLIYGLPGQTMESWQQSVEKLLALAPEHLSCYGLKLEKGTPLYERQDSETMADDDTQADMYLWMVERLKKAGYAQYEISNFARPGMESRHNRRYWLGEEYMGFGPSAHSYFGGRRYGFVRDLASYVQGVLHNGTLISESEDIPLREQAKEYIMLRMRTIEGVDGREYRNRYYMNFVPLEERFHEYEEYGWAVCTDRRWHFTPSGFLLSTPLIGDLLAIQEETVQETKGPIRKKRRQYESGNTD
jgi:putative oxygen-independent coproporphyrinogen III oxidase